MATKSFYARGDSSTANNATLNVMNSSRQPTVLITFDSGPNGDLVLERNGGAADPDTTVIIDGVSYNFKLEQTGNLPTNHDKVPDPLEGKQVTVISVVINGAYTRFFFVTDGSGTMSLMNQFGNGALSLTDNTFTPPDIQICFCQNTDILTPAGNKKVESLKLGDLVIRHRGDAVPILWIGQSTVTVEDMRRDATRRPIRIAANSFGQGVPSADLYVSAQHRVVLEGDWCEYYFAEPRVLVPAKHLVGLAADVVTPNTDINYYHILLDDHDLLISNGLLTESFQPSLRSYNGISAQMRQSLSGTVKQELLQALFKRPDAMRSLKASEARVLIKNFFTAQTPLVTKAISCAHAA